MWREWSRRPGVDCNCTTITAPGHLRHAYSDIMGPPTTSIPPRAPTRPRNVVQPLAVETAQYTLLILGHPEGLTSHTERGRQHPPRPKGQLHRPIRGLLLLSLVTSSHSPHHPSSAPSEPPPPSPPGAQLHHPSSQLQLFSQSKPDHHRPIKTNPGLATHPQLVLQ